ncbi:MAG: hypothetical protein JWM68_1385, partial [Verrucomicrobiales bacterium]|nr:hypothetical protein [Verrucomicrobiales bacterium]
MQGVEKLREHATLGQATKLLWALPYKWWLFSLLVAVPFAFGIGQKAYVVALETKKVHVRPATVSISGSSAASQYPLDGVRALAKTA